MISVIVPFYNEAGNLNQLIQELSHILSDFEYELILVDDGSTDNSAQIVTSQQIQNSKLENKIKLISSKHRRGKGKALQSGIAVATGSIVIFMDGDLQDDPADIPVFLAKINQGFDVVNGWRKNRKDTGVMRTISKLGNVFLWRQLFHTKLHDVNCGFKAFKKEALDNLTLYGDNFRLLPVQAQQEGYAIGEVIVSNRPRTSGVSKYTPLKVFSGLFDTLTAYFIFRFSDKPLHFFGPVGGMIFGLGSLIAVYLVFDRLVYGALLYRRPALLFALVFIIVGIQIIMTGIVAELVVYMSKKKKLF